MMLCFEIPETMTWEAWFVLISCLVAAKLAWDCHRLDKELKRDSKR